MIRIKHVAFAIATVASITILANTDAWAAGGDENKLSSSSTSSTSAEAVSTYEDIHKWQTNAREALLKKEEDKYQAILEPVRDLIYPAAANDVLHRWTSGGKERISQGINLLNELSQIHTNEEVCSEAKQRQLKELGIKSSETLLECNKKGWGKINSDKPYGDGDLTQLTPGLRDFVNRLASHEQTIQDGTAGVVAGVGLVGGGAVGGGVSLDVCGNKRPHVGARVDYGVGVGVGAGVGGETTRKDSSHENVLDGALFAAGGAGVGGKIPAMFERGQQEGSLSVGIGIGGALLSQKSVGYTGHVWLGTDFDHFRKKAHLTQCEAKYNQASLDRIAGIKTKEDYKRVMSEIRQIQL